MRVLYFLGSTTVGRPGFGFGMAAWETFGSSVFVNFLPFLDFMPLGGGLGGAQLSWVLGRFSALLMESKLFPKTDSKDAKEVLLTTEGGHVEGGAEFPILPSSVDASSEPLSEDDWPSLTSGEGTRIGASCCCRRKPIHISSMSPLSKGNVFEAACAPLGWHVCAQGCGPELAPFLAGDQLVDSRLSSNCCALKKGSDHCEHPKFVLPGPRAGPGVNCCCWERPAGEYPLCASTACCASTC
mmetsp:Transcript_83228/g.146753  ORF Transcript_83228/g.146753 Transcript_83228/m.146753 type:complete len:241 (+) Transcript_83228:512-1234(+)